LSIEAIPKKPLRINLENIRDKPSNELELLTWTPHFAVLRSRDGEEVTMRKDGRMVIRRAASEDAAKRTAAWILSMIAVAGQHD